MGGGNSLHIKTKDYRLNLTKYIDHEIELESFVSRSKDGHKGGCLPEIEN